MRNQNRKITRFPMHNTVAQGNSVTSFHANRLPVIPCIKLSTPENGSELPKQSQCALGKANSLPVFMQNHSNYQISYAQYCRRSFCRIVSNYQLSHARHRQGPFGWILIASFPMYETVAGRFCMSTACMKRCNLL